jgi:hypothetical protein
MGSTFPFWRARSERREPAPPLAGVPVQAGWRWQADLARWRPRSPRSLGLALRAALRLTLLLLWLAAGPGRALAAGSSGAPGSPAVATLRYRCGGDPLLARSENGAVDAVAIPNTSAGTPPGAFVVLEWRGTTLQLPRTNNAGPPSYTDGRWWWSLENPDQPRFRLRRGAIEEIPCSRES